METSVVFTQGQDGRLLGRVRGMKIMFPVAGMKPRAGRKYLVKVLRDTRPGERGGALLVEVLEDLDERYEKELAEAQAAAEQQRVERVDRFIASLQQDGLRPPARDELLEATADLHPMISLSIWDARIRPLMEEVNPPAIPPAKVRDAAAQWLRVYHRPHPEEPSIPDMCPWELQLAPDHILIVQPWGHSPLDGALVFNHLFPTPNLPGLERMALRVKASIKRDGTRNVEFQCGFMVPVSVDAGPSPDEMGRRSETSWAFQYSPRRLDDEQRAVAEKLVPWPSGESLKAYWEAVAAHEAWKTEMEKFVHNLAQEAQPFRQVVFGWFNSLTPSERLFLPRGDETLMRYCARSSI